MSWIIIFFVILVVGFIAGVSCLQVACDNIYDLLYRNDLYLSILLVANPELFINCFKLISKDHSSQIQVWTKRSCMASK